MKTRIRSTTVLSVRRGGKVVLAKIPRADGGLVFFTADHASQPQELVTALNRVVKTGLVFGSVTSDMAPALIDRYDLLRGVANEIGAMPSFHVGYLVVVSVVELEPALTEETQAQATTAQTAVNADLRILVQALNAKP